MGSVAVKVAVAALGPTLDDQVDERFGRARYLVIVDSESMSFDAVDNAANVDALQGAGIGAAELVSERGSDAVITGHLGPKAYRALGAAGITGYKGTGLTVREAVKALAEGRLPALDEGTAHAGMR